MQLHQSCAGKIVTFINVVMILCLRQVSHAQTDASQQRVQSASDILANYELYQKSLSAISVNCETWTHIVDANGSYWKCDIVKYATDNERWAIAVTDWNHLTTKGESTPSGKGLPVQRTFDGNHRFEVSTVDVGARIHSFVRMKSATTDSQTWEPPLFDDVLWGYLGKDHKRVSSIMLADPTTRLLDSREIVGGIACYIIECDNASGKYSIWIDPEHGYHIARARVLRQSEDIEDVVAKKAQLSPSLSDAQKKFIDRYRSKKNVPDVSLRTFELDNVRFSMINGYWLPMEADVLERIEFSNGAVTQMTRHHVRNDINLSPTFSPDSFVPNVTDGTRVDWVDFPGIQYEWRQGKAWPKVDEEMVGLMDESVSSIAKFKVSQSPADKVVVLQDPSMRPERNVNDDSSAILDRTDISGQRDSQFSWMYIFGGGSVLVILLAFFIIYLHQVRGK